MVTFGYPPYFIAMPANFDYEQSGSRLSCPQVAIMYVLAPVYYLEAPLLLDAAAEPLECGDHCINDDATGGKAKVIRRGKMFPL